LKHLRRKGRSLLSGQRLPEYSDGAIGFRVDVEVLQKVPPNLFDRKLVFAGFVKRLPGQPIPCVAQKFKHFPLEFLELFLCPLVQELGNHHAGSGDWRRAGLIISAIARDCLTTAAGAPFNIAAWDMKLGFGHTAIVTRAIASTPVASFVTISNPKEMLPGNKICFLALRFHDALGPSHGHFYTVVNHHSLAHRQTLTTCAQGMM
jgi:hypothetical protein